MKASVANLKSGNVTIREEVKGTKENEVCSLQGNCDVTSGECSCLRMYHTSDGNGGHGTRNDCGAVATS